MQEKEPLTRAEKITITLGAIQTVIAILSLLKG